MKTVMPTANIHQDVTEINKQAHDPQRFIRSCEDDYMHQLNNVVTEVILAGAKFIMLSGPSSSGKTTTAHKLSFCFAEKGINAPVVSLDDFFLGISHYPILPNGLPDMESVETLDLPLINKTFLALLNNGEAVFPVFDFETSQRSEKTKLIKLDQRDVIIIEGLHALNPLLTETVDENSIFKLYVSTRTQFMYKDQVVLTPKDNRLIRRMVRDHKFRGRPPKDTLEAWENVLEGEEKNIYAYRDSAHIKIDSAHNYEGCIFHHYILPMTEELKSDAKYGGKIREVVEILEAFDNIDFKYIPKDSLLREFIGF